MSSVRNVRPFETSIRAKRLLALVGAVYKMGFHWHTVVVFPLLLNKLFSPLTFSLLSCPVEHTALLKIGPW